MNRLARKVLLPFAFALVMAVSLQGPAMAAIVNVSIFDFGFNPVTVKPKQGDTVHWTNTGNAPHTATSNGCAGTGTNGVGLWCSPVLDDDETFDQVFTTAAKYPYFCDIHDEMKGTVQVNMKASPQSGGTGTTFTIIWAKGSVPTGFNADIQIKRPGAAGFSNWKTNQTGSQVSGSFVPDAGTGTYQFRSRLQNGTGGASGYSKAVSIQVS
jgi:plastocyanin